MRVQKMTPENAKGAFVEIPTTGAFDLSGVHEARVFFVESKTSAKGNSYLSVGTEIQVGPCQGQTVFGPVFKGRDMDRFLRALGLDPQAVTGQLAGEQV